MTFVIIFNFICFPLDLHCLRPAGNLFVFSLLTFGWQQLYLWPFTKEAASEATRSPALDALFWPSPGGRGFQYLNCIIGTSSIPPMYLA